MVKQLYIIKGTGLSLDGTIVSVVKSEGDYCLVSPPNSKIELQTTMVHNKCLQPLDSDKNVTYTIIIGKAGQDDRGLNFSENIRITIENCGRDVSLETISDYIENNLTPILRME